MKNPKTKIVFGMLLALGFILYLAARGPKIIKESVVSPVVRCENHNLSAKVVRREAYVMNWGDEDMYYKWWIVVTNPDEHRFEALLAKDDSYSFDEAIRERRDISYDLSWDDSGRFLTWSNSAGEEGTAYFTGNFVFYAPTPLMVGEKAQPLTADIKKKMQVHPDMMAASASISGYVVLTGHYEKDVINLREDVLLLVQPDFHTHETIMSFGPVIVSEAAGVWTIKSAKWVFLDGEYHLARIVTAKRAYALESEYAELDDWKMDEMFGNCKDFILISRKDLSEK